MLRTAAAVTSCLALASAARGGEHRFRVTPESTSSISGGLASPVVGTLIGNWDPVANPTGTRTMRGLFGGNTSTDNQTIDYTADLAATLVADRTPTGGFNVRIPTNGDPASVNGLAFDLLAGESVDLPITLDLVFQSFRTRQPNSIFIGSASFPPIPIGTGAINALRIEQAGEATATVTPIPGGGSAFAATVPVNVVLQASLFGQPIIDQVLPGVLPVAGTVGAGPGVPGASIAFKDGFSTPLPELPEFTDQPLPVPTILPPGGTANLLFSGQVDGPKSTLGFGIAVDLALTSDPVPVDITQDGKVDGADLSQVLWAWGTSNPACDLDESGTVDGADLGLVIACWGPVQG
jgi:hypothetical protein